MNLAEKITSCPKENIADLLITLESADIARLVAWLVEKDDNFRYKVFLLLQARAQSYADVYPYWDALVEKLGSSNSYQRSLGMMLIAENARWDTQGKMNAVMDAYLRGCEDEKPITVRQCIQGLKKIALYHTACHAKIIQKLLSLDLMQRKESMRKSLLLDILGVFCEIQKIQPDKRIEQYYQQAMTGGILDEKTKRQVAWV